MSKAENGFMIIRERMLRATEKTLLAACEFMTLYCGRCPLNGEDLCVEKQVPPGVIEKDKHSACTDWVMLYFGQVDTLGTPYQDKINSYHPFEGYSSSCNTCANMEYAEKNGVCEIGKEKKFRMCWFNDKDTSNG